MSGCGRVWWSGCLILVLGLSAGCRQAAPPVQGQLDLSGVMSDDSREFASVTPGRTFSFPADHGEHPEFKTEWWYVTGNLSDTSGRGFGIQLTFFSSGLPKTTAVLDNPWSAERVMMAHLAISDPKQQRFQSFERFSRRALGLCGVKSAADGIEIWLEDWRLQRLPSGRWRLRAEQDEMALDLELVEKKPPVLQGEGGYSRKGPSPEDASYYVSLTRLETSGSLTFEGETFSVAGSSWFDHEWSSRALAPGLVGWDWFSLQLDDGWELMLFTLRYADGRLEPTSSGTLVAPDGRGQALNLEQFSLEVLDRHRSARGVDYPSGWRIAVPGADLDLHITPSMLDQEMVTSVPYWEGAVTVRGKRRGTPLGGRGFVELTGYAQTP